VNDRRKKLFNNDRWLERQGCQCLHVAAAFRIHDVDRHAEFLFEECLCRFEDFLPDKGSLTGDSSAIPIFLLTSFSSVTG